MDLVGQLVSEFGWANGFGLFLPPLTTSNLQLQNQIITEQKLQQWKRTNLCGWAPMGLEVRVSSDGGDGIWDEDGGWWGDGDVGGHRQSAVSWWGMGLFLFSFSFSRFRGF